MPPIAPLHTNLEPFDDKTQLGNAPELDQEVLERWSGTKFCKCTLKALNMAEIAKCIDTSVAYMRDNHHLNIATLLYYLTALQEDEADTYNTKYACTAFLHCDEFPWMICKWRQGQDRVHSRGFRTQAARVELDNWSINNELTEEYLLGLNIRDLAKKTQATAPVLWKLLHNASTAPAQLAQSTYKDPTAPIQFNSVYFKASGLAARANDTTHLYGITMSHLWVYHLIEKLSNNA
ncbi:hypothetical protein BC835DRAFT_1423208 [Cytidiella melzeri]|nr:hypothetical protein BC835DRAFT_1423208 [Cytidiella melzeri]